MPIDDALPPGQCVCEFTPDPTDPDNDDGPGSWHYLRRCQFCRYTWRGLHCPHDGYQNPCPKCGKRPATVPER